MATYSKPPLDASLYKPDEEELKFMKSQTGIQDPDTLKQHIIAVQTKAYDIYSYPCIRAFAFARPKISESPAYQHVLTLGRERDGAILLDLGCCFGTDVRKAASDGFPVQNILASDLHPDFWTRGHELFQSTPDTCPIAFLAGDVFDTDFIEPAPPATSPPQVPAPPLASLTHLTQLRGHVAAIHVSAVFHLFSEPQQLRLVRALAGLLSPLPGSMILGFQVGRRTKGIREEMPVLNDGNHMFCHSPDSWVQMWGEVFPEGTVKVDAHLELGLEMPAGEENTGFMVWSVTRV
ncbi:hypothetical protein FB451DRAFT_1100012 [Mycena latifolia]|nr:hypothetical protein FB451DRAFT_1100012 [Mycena latifolia]